MGTKDRLAELRRVAERARGEAAVYLPTTEPAPALDTDTDTHRPDIEQIFQQVERMRGCLLELDANTQLVRRLHADPAFHVDADLQERLEAAAAAARRAGGAARGALGRLEELQAAGDAGAGDGAARARIARLQFAGARAHFAAALRRHHAALQELQDSRLALLHGQIQLIDLDVTEEECQNLLDSRNISLFVDNVRAETAAARGALRGLEARRAELARLEGSLADVRDLFQHLALLVAAQGERVDSVEYYALQASEHVESGQHQLLKGTVTRTKARKKKLNLIVCLSAGFLVVLLVLLVT